MRIRARCAGFSTSSTGSCSSRVGPSCTPQVTPADGTEAFRSPCEPEPYDFVTLTLRVGKNQAVRTSVVIAERAGRIDMDLRASDEWFDWYRAEIELIDKPLHYFFEVATANGVFRYDRLGVMLSDRETVCFQITPGFHTPDWAKGAVMYQIFVDRFCNGDPTNDVQTGEYYYIDRPTKEVTDWGRAPEACDVQEFYGGDLAGVIKKLDYLRRLGIEVIATNDVHFLRESDGEAHDILLCLGTGKKVADKDRVTAVAITRTKAKKVGKAKDQQLEEDLDADES